MNQPLIRTCLRRNVVNIFLYVAERSRYYYSTSDIPEMLETFIPLITQEVC
jgi:proteasome activator subunit 4